MVATNALYAEAGKQRQLLVFVKHYDPVKETLTFKGHHLLPCTAKVRPSGGLARCGAAVGGGARVAWAAGSGGGCVSGV